MLAGEPGSGASEASVDFVENQQNTPLIGPLSQARKKPSRGYADPSASLHGFDDHCADVARGRSRLQRRLQFLLALPVPIGLGKVDKASKLAQLVPERFAKMGPFGGIQGSIADSVVSAPERQHPGLARGQTRRLESGLDRLEAGASEDHLAGLHRSGGSTAAGPPLEGEATQFASQTGFQRMRVNIAHGMQQLPHLPLASPHDG